MTIEELRVIIRVQTEGLQQQVTGIKQQFSGLEATVGKSTGRLSGLFAAAGKAAAAAFSAKAVVDLGKQAISLASDMQEVENVVVTAFGDMSDEVDKWAKTTVDKFGMSELSAKRTASTYMAMSKGLGLAGEQAAEMAIQVAERTGDIASFYNMSQEQADTMLKSIWTGETESLKQIGVVMTQANLDAYALAKGIGKTTDEMSQSEQVMLRYQYVMEQTSLAAGDFEKTSGSWANQTRVLSERFKELLGILGSGLIQVLTPVVKLLNMVLSILIKVTSFIGGVLDFLFGWLFGGDSGSQAAGTDQIQADIEGASDAMGDLAENTEAVETSLKGALAGFDELNVLTRGFEAIDMGDASGGSGGGTGSGSTAGDGSGDGSGDGQEILPAIDASMAEKAAERIEKAFDRIMNHPITEWLEGEGSEAWDAYFGAIEKGYTLLEESDAPDRLRETLEELALELENPAWDDFPDRLGEITGALMQVDGRLAASREALAVWRSDVAASGEQYTAFSLLVLARTEAVQDRLSDLSGYMAGTFAVVWTSGLTGSAGTAAAWAAAVVTSCARVQAAFAAAGTSVVVVWSSAAASVDGFTGALQRLLSFISGAFTAGWQTGWNGVKTIFSSIWEGIWDVIRWRINLMIDGINLLLQAITFIPSNILKFLVWAAESLTGTTFEEKWGFSIPTDPPQIPRLAAGGLAVNPTLALIGEGRDREAVLPLNDGVYAELARGIAGAGGGLANEQVVVLLQGILDAVAAIDPTLVMDGTTLARTANGYFEAEQRRKGPSVVRVV